MQLDGALEVPQTRDLSNSSIPSNSQENLGKKREKKGANMSNDLGKACETGLGDADGGASDGHRRSFHHLLGHVDL